MKAELVILSILAGVGFGAHGQGFTNLNFEKAIVQVPDPTYGFLDWSLAVPGWSHSSGADTSSVYYGSEHVGLSQYYLLMDATSPVYAPGTQLAGAYSLAFSSGYQNGNVGQPWVNAFISQTGTVPSGSSSVQMLASGPFEVFVGGVNIAMYSLGANKYGGDVSAFSGSVAELRIVNTAPTGYVHTPTIVDNIVFSSEMLPERIQATLSKVGNAVRITWNSTLGASYEVQALTSLTQPWTEATTVGVVTGTLGTTSVDDPETPTGGKYYRVVRRILP